MIPFFRKIRYNLAQNNQFFKYSRYAIGEIVLVVIGILIALQINNWNQERISDKKIRNQMKLVRAELIEDIASLEKEVQGRYKRSQLMSRSIKILELESTLSDYNKQVLDSAFLLYRRMEPRFNNTRTYESFLSSESDIIEDRVYSKMNAYMDEFNRTNARVERFARTIMEVEYDILLNSSVRRERSGEYSYPFKVIQKDKELRETIRKSGQWYAAISNQYRNLLEKATELEGIIKTNYELTEE